MVQTRHIKHQYSSTVIFSVSLLLLFLSCQRTTSNEITDEYKKYKFDSKVIEKLPVYDSLVSTIIANYSYFKQFIKEDDAYRSYKYVPQSNQPGTDKKSQAEVSRKVDRYFTQLGNDFIVSFTFYTDSSIKINTRQRPSETNAVVIEENLSYYPQKNIYHREYPIKDTILNEHWQYWVRFNKLMPF